jgi:hypothetical protein
MGKHVRFGAIILTVLSLTAATNVAEAAHKTRSFPIEYCGDNFCQRHDVGRDCHDLGKDRGQKIIYQVDRRYCYCICP